MKKELEIDNYEA